MPLRQRPRNYFHQIFVRISTWIYASGNHIDRLYRLVYIHIYTTQHTFKRNASACRVRPHTCRIIRHNLYIVINNIFLRVLEIVYIFCIYHRTGPHPSWPLVWSLRGYIYSYIYRGCSVKPGWSLQLLVCTRAVRIRVAQFWLDICKIPTTSWGNATHLHTHTQSAGDTKGVWERWFCGSGETDILRGVGGVMGGFVYVCWLHQLFGC